MTSNGSSSAVGRNRLEAPPATVGRLVLSCFLVTFAGTSSSQDQAERQSKAVKPRRPRLQRRAYCGTKRLRRFRIDRPEDRPFKGMKYRLIGPFRGGRSLTAGWSAGDPTTYYFGATGGGVWKSTDGAMTRSRFSRIEICSACDIP